MSIKSAKFGSQKFNSIQLKAEFKRFFGAHSLSYIWPHFHVSLNWSAHDKKRWRKGRIYGVRIELMKRKMYVSTASRYFHVYLKIFLFFMGNTVHNFAKSIDGGCWMIFFLFLLFDRHWAELVMWKESEKHKFI